MISYFFFFIVFVLVEFDLTCINIIFRFNLVHVRGHHCILIMKGTKMWDVTLVVSCVHEWIVESG